MRTIITIAALLSCAFNTSISNSLDDSAEIRRQFVRYQYEDTVHWGELREASIFQLSAAPYLGGRETGVEVKREAVTLQAPADARHMFGTAWNFRSHLGNREPSQYPTVFLVPGNTLVGPEQAIVRHKESTRLAYEAELAVVIGKQASNISVEEAPSYIFGVTAGNDVTDRAWQLSDNDWLRAKGARGFNAVGPTIVTGVDYNNITIIGRLNGKQVQKESTADLLFNMNELVSWISQYFTLEPGDLVWSGTMGQPRFLQAGDVFEVELEGLIRLKNNVVESQ